MIDFLFLVFAIAIGVVLGVCAVATMGLVLAILLGIRKQNTESSKGTTSVATLRGH